MHFGITKQSGIQELTVPTSRLTANWRNVLNNMNERNGYKWLQFSQTQQHLSAKHWFSLRNIIVLVLSLPRKYHWYRRPYEPRSSQSSCLKCLLQHWPCTLLSATQRIGNQYPSFLPASYQKLLTSGGARTSRQPGHFQVTKVVRQVIGCKLQIPEQ